MLRVYCNPYFRINAAGVAQGAVVRADILDRYIGAHLDIQASLANGERTFTFSNVACLLPWNAYYVELIKSQCLFPADSDTATACGLAFVDPTDALTAFKAAAIAAWSAQHGDATPACATDGFDSFV